MTHTATIIWERNADESFTDNRFHRAHSWTFDGGVKVPGSAAPAAVPPPLSDPSAVDPEEAFVASLSSCHMLWFLSIAAKRGFVVEKYIDHAEGALGPIAEGERRQMMTTAALHPRVTFGGDRKPSAADHEAMHHEAHEKCFIANSVKTQVTVKPEMAG
jgi:organic hydroperoxide reductase OsmC/OhrA